MRRQWSVVSGQWSAEAAGDDDLCQAANFSQSSPVLTTDHRPLTTAQRGFTLIELIATLMVMTILTMGAIPLVKVSVKRQREQALREALHEIRNAIDQFHREAIAGATIPQAGRAPQPNPQTGQQQQPLIDPRVRVGITDNTIFGTDNPDRYPPDLDTLVNGVSVTPLAGVGGTGGGGIVGLDPNSTQTATSNTLTSMKKKVYLREIPVDPMTGERSWELRSTYDSKDTGSWGGENVFDVRSKSTATALNGEKYSDW
jgi:general secretion pathway protein G